MRNFLIEYSLIRIVKPKFTRRNEIWCRILEIDDKSKNVRKTHDRIFFCKISWDAAYIGQFVFNKMYSYICFGIFPVLWHFEKKITKIVGTITYNSNALYTWDGWVFHLVNASLFLDDMHNLFNFISTCLIFTEALSLIFWW